MSETLTLVLKAYILAPTTSFSKYLYIMQMWNLLQEILSEKFITAISIVCKNVNIANITLNKFIMYEIVQNVISNYVILSSNYGILLKEISCEKY